VLAVALILIDAAFVVGLLRGRNAASPVEPPQETKI
jgi:hypothetical protein